MAGLIATLSSLDDILASLRAELVQLSSAGSSESATALPRDSATSTSRKAPDYASLEESLDIARAKRLVAAREKAIKSVKSSLKARQTISSEHTAVGGEGC
ncbi:hypothetical protein A0H81_10258 [Grifola frondosa]|uniref:Uncharacterized protein n=1 Tax=Grifola frondosa TaxID=5627 RepID=A0A1C7M462_GRIFR|nr:hypothetical protein A0H81_10258 [Grifola frondosa]